MNEEEIIRGVYLHMAEEKRSCVKKLLEYSVKMELPKADKATELSLMFDTFSENEKYTTYYLMNSAVLGGTEIFGILKSWEELGK